MSKRDYYETLGLSKGANADEIKKAFRRCAKDLHPDRNADNPKAEEQFKEANEAYDILKDPEKKAAYDRFGHAAFEGGTGASAGRAGGQGGFGDFSDIFDDLFGDFMGGGRAGGRNRATRGADLRYKLRISLEEAYHGAQKTINVTTNASCDSCGGSGAAKGSEPTRCQTCAGMGKVRAQQGFFTVERTCPNCSGTGQVIKNPCSTCYGSGQTKKPRSLSVSIPKGVETDNRIRLAGEGEAGTRGGPQGDLYIFVDVDQHKIFERDGVNLFCKVPISMTSAALGGEIEVPTLDGGRSRVRIPEGSQSGRQMRLRSKGMPALRGGSMGDMFIELSVETPVNLTAHQRDLLAEFAKQSQDNSPQSNSFFQSVKKFWDDLTG